ncbi:MAG: dUTP diphosphatase [Lachnospirales bacterium]
MDTLNLIIEKTENAQDLPLPDYQTEGSSGMDLYANVEDFILINPDEIKKISVGIKIKLPLGYEAQIRSRSSLGLKYGISMINNIGTIDSDYRGEIFVTLINHSKEIFTVKRGDRIAQMIIARYSYATLVEETIICDTKRGEGGFGSTGK